jgi:hypothetical protein
MSQQNYHKLINLKIPYRQNLKLIALTQPQTLQALQKLPGIGPVWLNRWGQRVLDALTT